MSSVYFGDNIFLQFASDLVGPTGTTIQIVPTAQGGSFKLDGYGDFIDITQGTVTALPEPATWGLMLLGFGGLGAVLRRRRADLALAAA
ncbi:MAG: PEP-CTERM sorting domain-containing protein [Phenylobacterium sp.]|nr:MAG: PEP-CTERM sorting domain-containing protein [Phenylobacterium sp.]